MKENMQLSTCNVQVFQLDMEKANCIDISKLNILRTIRHKKFALKQKNTELKHTHLKRNCIEVLGTLFLFAK
jgi:hypothetical protein